jgi:hypothetical protein
MTDGTASSNAPGAANAAAALRAFLVGARNARAAVDPVLGGITNTVLARLREEGLVTWKATKSALRIVAPYAPVVTAYGAARMQADTVVPCVMFKSGDRDVPVKLVYYDGRWSWADSAGAGVDGQPLTQVNMERVLLALLSGRV